MENEETPQDTESRAADAQSGSAPAGARKRHRRSLFILFGVVVLGLFIAAGAWWLLLGAHRVSTDNAYVDADVARVSSRTSGVIARIPVRETQTVRAGDILVEIDPADARLALERAEAEHGRAERRVRQYFARYNAARADTAQALVQLAQAEKEFERRKGLGITGAISAEDLSNARSALEDAEAALASAEARAASYEVLIQGTDISSNPEVVAAKAAVETARLALSRTTIRSPVDGIIVEKRAALGQRVPVGQLLMSVVPISEVYVEANFKENQLRKVRPGQPVRLVSDLYGSDVVFHGRVSALAGGTGSAFAAIPAQNATGNWIKVIQRVPVRIDLDRAELQDHPLRVGLSMTAEIDIR